MKNIVSEDKMIEMLNWVENFYTQIFPRKIVEHILKHCYKFMAVHSQEIINMTFIGNIHPKSVKYFELTTGKDTKSGTK